MGLLEDFGRLIGYQPYKKPPKYPRSTSALSRYGLDREHGLGSREDRMGIVLSSLSNDPAFISGIALATQAQIQQAQQNAVNPIPNPRFFPFLVNVLANTRNTWSIGPLIGNVVITEFDWNSGVGADPPSLGWHLGTSLIPVTERNIPIPGSRGWQSLFEFSDPFNYSTIPGNKTGEWPIETIPPSTSKQGQYRPKLIVRIPTFYLVISHTNGTVGANTFLGHVALLERVSEQQLANVVLAG